MSNYDSNNIFWKIINKEVPCNILYEDKYALAFPDINPAASVHILVVPKLQFVSFNDFIDHADPELLSGFFRAIRKVIKGHQLDKDGYRLITNDGEHGMQTIKHFHVHILGGEILGPLVVADKYHI